MTSSPAVSFVSFLQEKKTFPFRRKENVPLYRRKEIVPPLRSGDQVDKEVGAVKEHAEEGFLHIDIQLWQHRERDGQQQEDRKQDQHALQEPNARADCAVPPRP